MIRRRYIKAAVPADEHSAICARADKEGLTLAGYIRVAVARDAERLSIAQTMDAIRTALPNGKPSAPESSLSEIEPTLDELLQLMRLLATRADPQGAARVTASIKNKFPRKDQK